MGEGILHDTVATPLTFDGFKGKPDELITLLQYFQHRFGYISAENVHQIALFLRVSEAHIYGVASFYSQFHFTQPGDTIIRVCQGTACHVQGGEQLSQELTHILGVGPGETTPDHRFDFQEVACLGCCAQASVVEINGKIFGKMTPDQLRKVLREHDTV
jgi:NADH-quinone oxidoreductase subunit E